MTVDDSVQRVAFYRVVVAGKTLFTGPRPRADAFVEQHNLSGIATIEERFELRGERWVTVSDGVAELRRYTHGFSHEDEIGKYTVKRRRLTAGGVVIEVSERDVTIALPDEGGTIEVERSWGEGLDIEVSSELRERGFLQP